MAKVMLVIGLVCGIFLLDPQKAMRQLDLGLEAIGWKQAIQPVRLATPQRPHESPVSGPFTPPRR